MVENQFLVREQLSFLNSTLLTDILESADIVDVPAGIEVLREEQYVKALPVILKGLVKVSTRFKDREMLLYYIEPAQSCVMTFSAMLRNQPSRIHACTEENSTVLMLPISKLRGWIKEHPDLNFLFHEMYDLRYSELLETLHHVLLNKMDKRLLDYLRQRSQVNKSQVHKLSHAQLANELGTVREVISRVIKKLESEGLIEQRAEGIFVQTL